MNNRAGELRYLWHKYNKALFGGKLREPTLKVDDRPTKYDGKFIYSWSYHTGKRTPNRSRVIIMVGNYTDGCLVHEMIHQYQFEVLSREPSHDCIFNSIARKCERILKQEVR